MKYWLMKTEPDEWSWKDQVEKSKKGAVWDGVRNFQARNNLKEMNDIDNIDFNDLFGIMFQYPNTYGDIIVNNELINNAKNKDILVTCSADLLSLIKIKSPKDLGCDISFGTAQQFGIPMWYGGPHSAFFATKEEYIRLLPGRLVGRSIDRNDKPASKII